MFIGWDRATDTHDVTVMDASGRRIDRWEFAHTEEGFAKTLARLREHGDPARVPVAIETTRGLAVDRLLAAGHPIVPVHPNAFHAMRPRWGASKAKTDAGDSMKLADYLRTDGHLLPRLVPTEQATLDLQALTRYGPFMVIGCEASGRQQCPSPNDRSSEVITGVPVAQGVIDGACHHCKTFERAPCLRPPIHGTQTLPDR